MNDELVERVAEAIHDADLGKEKVLDDGKLRDVPFAESLFHKLYRNYARAAIAATLSDRTQVETILSDVISAAIDYGAAYPGSEGERNAAESVEAERAALLALVYGTEEAGE